MEQTTDAIKQLGTLISNKLRIERSNGVTVPPSGKCGRIIAEEYNKKFDAKIDDSTIRDAINYERSIGKPIGNNGKGYFWALNDEELEHTRAQMRSRIGKMFQALKGIDTAFLKTDIGKLLQQELELERTV